jgi:hypothetical protein
VRKGIFAPSHLGFEELRRVAAVVNIVINQSSNSKPDSSSWMDFVKYIIALVAILAFGWFVYYMLGQTKTDEKEWTRAVYLFQGVEAIAFAAAGFMFGKEVHRERADKAEKRANEKEEGAAKGKALADLVKAKAEAHPVRVSRFAAAVKGPETAPEIASLDLEDLALTAKKLFP